MNTNDQHIILVEQAREELVAVLAELNDAQQLLRDTAPNKKDQLGKQASLLAAEIMRAAIRTRVTTEVYKRTLVAQRLSPKLDVNAAD